MGGRGQFQKRWRHQDCRAAAWAVRDSERFKQLARIICKKTAIEVQPFRNEGMPFGIANLKSQI